MSTHGTSAAYDNGCHCPDCRHANTRRVKAWNLKTRHGTQPIRVPIAPVRDHVLRLRATGWTLTELAIEAGISFHTVKAVTANTAAKKYVTRTVAAAILAIEPLEPVTFDTVLVDRFVAGEADWRQLTIDERCEAARRMDRAGVSRNVIAAATHLNSRTLWAAFDAEEIAS